MYTSNHYHSFGATPSGSQTTSNTVFPPNSNPEDAHLHATLERIDEIANEDVEMQAPLSEQAMVMVVDTNILLHFFDTLQQFVVDLEAAGLPITIVIPGSVVYELDGQKNRDGLAWFARRASAWLLKKVKERKSVKGQANEETCKPSGNWKVRFRGEDFDADSERVNDGLILDCCQFFMRGRRTFLCSADKNLCVEAETAGISSISPTRLWSSQEVARAIFGDGIDSRYFGVYNASYQDPNTAQATSPVALHRIDDDGMEVDDDASVSRPLPSHALDLLHLQVIDHFTRLLVELIGQVGGPEIHRKLGADDTSASRYAPQWVQNRRPYLEWNASECLEYLASKKRQKYTNPRLDVFLSKPYSCRGARRGQDWSFRDWEIALRALGEVGDVWQEVSIRESLHFLQPHLACVFATKMRPTGI